jgi:hypothetical protein
VEQSKNLSSLNKENLSKNLRPESSFQTKNPFQAGRSLQRTPPNSNLKAQSPLVEASRRYLGEACINLGMNLDSECNETVAKIPKQSSTSRPKIATIQPPSHQVQKVQDTKVIPLKTNSTSLEDPKSSSEIELQLKLSNELLEKYQLQEEMIRLRQQMRAQQIKSLDVNLAQQEMKEQQQREHRQQQQQEKEKEQEQEEQLRQQHREIYFDENGVGEEDVMPAPEPVAQSEEGVEETALESEDFPVEDVGAPFETVPPSPPTSPLPRPKATYRKKVAKKPSSPEVYVDLGVPYLVPKGMTFQPLQSKVSNRLVGHVPKSPPRPQGIVVESSPKVTKTTKVTKEPVKRKKALVTSPPPKDRNQISDPLDATPSSKSPPLKQSKKGANQKNKKSEKNLDRGATGNGFHLFCDHIREDAIKILESRISEGGSSKGGGKGKKKKYSATELEELFEKMWSVLSSTEKLQWNSHGPCQQDPLEEEEGVLIPLPSDDLFASTTRSKKSSKTKKTAGKSQKGKSQSNDLVEQLQEESPKEKQQQEKTRKKRTIPDPSEDLFDRVENTSAPPPPSSFSL